MISLWILIKHHLVLEYKNGVQALSLVILVWIISYVIYRLTPELGLSELNFIYWIFLLLVSVNIALRQENQMGDDDRLVMYTLISPTLLILSRIIFNFFYLSVIALLFYFFLILFFSPLMVFQLNYLFLLILGSFAISSCLSLVTSMGAKGGNQNTLVSILGMPLLIPVILTLDDIGSSLILSEVIPGTKYLIILGISFIGISLSLILFPFVWKE